jgi:phospholipase D1/2
VMRLYLDAFAAAQKFIYIENQYLTSGVVEAALASRLRERNGPEIIMVFPRECSGWMEESTMGILRGRFLRKLREADRHGKLRIYYPIVEGLGNEVLNVHSKVLVVDDDLLRIGSANLTNRSMGVDTECDLALEAGGDERIRMAIRRFRNGLLAEHLGRKREDIEAAIDGNSSLENAVESLRGGPHTLAPFTEQAAWIDPLLPDTALIDPEKPLYLEEMMEQFIPKGSVSDQKTRKFSYRSILFLLVLAAFLVLGAAWQWTPLGDLIDLSSLLEGVTSLRNSPAAPLAVLAVFIIGGLVMFPVTLLILATAVAFEPLAGFSYALLGSLASAMTTFALGRFLGQEKVSQITGPRLKKIHRQLIRRGMLTMIVIRYLPVAPFTIVNLIAGAARIRVIDFFFGTAFGMAPGILAINVFERSLTRAIRAPEPQNLLLLGGVVAGLLVLFWLLRRWIGKKQSPGAEHPERV